MSPLILIFATNPWHSFSSRELIAIATTPTKRDTLVRRFLQKHAMKKITQQTLQTALEQIRSSGQTQCLTEELDIEIDTEEVTPNEIQC